MAESLMTEERSKLLREIFELKRIQRNLIYNNQICLREIEKEKQFPAEEYKYLKKVATEIVKERTYKNELEKFTEKIRCANSSTEFIYEEPNLAKLFQESANDNDIVKLIEKIDETILNCCSIQYKALARFFPGEVKDLDKEETSPEFHYETLESVTYLVQQSDNQEEVSEKYAEEWYEKFRRFSVVDESGLSLGGEEKSENDEVTDNKTQELNADFNPHKYILITSKVDRGDGGHNSAYELMTVSSLSMRQHSSFGSHCDNEESSVVTEFTDIDESDSGTGESDAVTDL